MAGKVNAIPAGYEGTTEHPGSSVRSWQHRAQDASRVLDGDAVIGVCGFGQIGQSLFTAIPSAAIPAINSRPSWCRMR